MRWKIVTNGSFWRSPEPVYWDQRTGSFRSLAIRFRRSNLVSCGGAAVVAYRLIWHFDESPETTPPFPVGGVTITDLNLRHFVPLTFYRI